MSMPLYLHSSLYLHAHTRPTAHCYITDERVAEIPQSIQHAAEL